MFAGKQVRISHTNTRLKDEVGLCTRVHEVKGETDEYQLELESGSMYGFVPETLTESSSDGELRALAGGRRKIEVIG